MYDKLWHLLRVIKKNSSDLNIQGFPITLWLWSSSIVSMYVMFVTWRHLERWTPHSCPMPFLGRERWEEWALSFLIYLLLKWYTEKAMAPHSSTLAWKTPWMEEPGGLQSMGSLRVGHGWATFTFHFHALEKEMATHSSVLAWRIPGTGQPGGLPSMGSHRVGHDWSDLAVANWYNYG